MPVEPAVPWASSTLAFRPQTKALPEVRSPLAGLAETEKAVRFTMGLWWRHGIARRVLTTTWSCESYG